MDRAPKAQDIYSLLLEIKDKQATGQVDIEHLNSKLNDMHKNLDVNPDKLNVKTVEFESHVLKLETNQLLTEEKMENLDQRTSNIESVLGEHQLKHDQIEEKCADRVSQVEYELAADIETVKNNIE